MYKDIKLNFLDNKAKEIFIQKDIIIIIKATPREACHRFFFVSVEVTPWRDPT
jgi:hypothetical protein